MAQKQQNSGALAGGTSGIVLAGISGKRGELPHDRSYQEQIFWARALVFRALRNDPAATATACGNSANQASLYSRPLSPLELTSARVQDERLLLAHCWRAGRIRDVTERGGNIGSMRSTVLKRGMFGTYRHVSERHLDRYLTEFDFAGTLGSGLA
jgi:hypothetical protein